MKYVILLGDGMADEPLVPLAGKTPLQAAATPNMDDLATHGVMGLVQTVPAGMAPGSDVANLSVMGYDPGQYYTGRAPLEAVSMGIELRENDVAFRCNLVTLSAEGVFKEKAMLDYSSDEISTLEARELIADINQRLSSDIMRFYPGISYRHLLVWKNGLEETVLTPPHDISGRSINGYLPQGEGHEALTHLIQESNKFLPMHPINSRRTKKGLRPASAIWLWGQGKKPALPSFADKYGLSGAMVSAVDLLKGIGRCAGLEVIEVEGATGNLDTNFQGKVNAALESLKQGHDFVYVHVEAPDEAGHRKELANKIKAIEEVDNMLAGLRAGLSSQYADYKIMLLPDHPTPISTGTHSGSPVPFVIYSSGQNSSNRVSNTYDEKAAAARTFFLPSGAELMDYFIKP